MYFVTVVNKGLDTAEVKIGKGNYDSLFYCNSVSKFECELKPISIVTLKQKNL